MIYRIIIINNHPADVAAFAPPTGHGVLYELIRVTDGIFLFLNDHIDRLNHSAQLAGVELALSAAEIRKQLERLLQQNGVQTGNIKLEYYFLAGKVQYQAAYFIPHHYPSDKDYRDGVKTSLLVAERTNPNAKIEQAELRDRANRVIAEKNLYEVILVHPDGYITEGSRSTIFMVKNGTVYTAPEADVLPGITRKYILQTCRDLSVHLVEARIAAGDLPGMDAVFIAGTSPKILPVALADEYRFDPANITVRQIMEKYDKLVFIMNSDDQDSKDQVMT
ncbi:MAG: aminotransferase class IV [Bacteroidales bacterium]|jgi:branched-chain amino acid aminotransferase|nr:aminotransferase class IV [Bacteroidales bacterium]